MTKWDDRWLDLATHVAGWSKDRSKQVGCVIVGPANQVLSTGYNGFPRGINDDIDERHDRPAKYDWTEHAERNAIYNAARYGVPLQGTTMYLPWFPCVGCARAIIQAGLTRLVAVTLDCNDSRNDKWSHDFDVSAVMLKEAGVEVTIRLINYPGEGSISGGTENK